MATEIVSAPNKKLRVAVLHYIIKLAKVPLFLFLLDLLLEFFSFEFLLNLS